jgi:hypothetical protein
VQITTLSNRLHSLHFIAVRFLPLGLTALHLFFRDGERPADGVVDPFGICIAMSAGTIQRAAEYPKLG